MYITTSFLISIYVLAATSPAIPAGNVPTSAQPVKSQMELYQAPVLASDQIQKLPANLARSYLGTRISLAQTPNAASSNPAADPKLGKLLSDDFSFRYDLPPGKSVFILSLPQNIATNRLSFLIGGSEGEVQVSAATLDIPANSAWWQALGGKKSFTPGTPTVVDWPWADVHYVKVEVKLKSPGTIGALGLFGAPSTKDFRAETIPADSATKKTAASTSMPEVTDPTQQPNVASITSQGRIPYVSSGVAKSQTATSMIDNDLGSGYDFDPADENPCYIVELAESHPICRISTYFQAPTTGSWEVYPLTALPSDPAAPGATPAPVPAAPVPPAAKPVKTALAANHSISSLPGLRMTMTSWLWGQTILKSLKLPDDYFKNHKPSFTIEGRGGDPFASTEFKPHNSRFLLLRWVPGSPVPPGSPGVQVFQVCIFTDPTLEHFWTRPTTNLSSVEPDLGGARGLAISTLTPPPPTTPPDPPRQPLPTPPTPPVISP